MRRTVISQVGPVLVRIPRGKVPCFGKIENCLLTPNKSAEAMFAICHKGHLHPTLDGYAIIPMSEYRKLKGKEGRPKRGVRSPRSSA